MDASNDINTVKLLVDVSLGHQLIVIPPKLENQIIDYYRSLNHLGIKATQRFITARFVFHAIRRKIRYRVRACTGCQTSKVYRQVVSPIVSRKMPTARLDTVHAELCGPYPKCQGFFYLLVCIDRFSRFVVENCGLTQQINLSKIKLTTKLLTTDEVRSMQSSNSLRISS